MRTGSEISCSQLINWDFSKKAFFVALLFQIMLLWVFFPLILLINDTTYVHNWYTCQSLRCIIHSQKELGVRPSKVGVAAGSCLAWAFMYHSYSLLFPACVLYLCPREPHSSLESPQPLRVKACTVPCTLTAAWCVVNWSIKIILDAFALNMLICYLLWGRWELLQLCSVENCSHIQCVWHFINVWKVVPLEGATHIVFFWIKHQVKLANK